jgi:CMP-N,N'-diacetyllegionaminic acid synthase
MSPTLALIPAKGVSVQVPRKNWKPITSDGLNCTDLAYRIGFKVCDRAVASVDGFPNMRLPSVLWIQRPPNLPDTMLAVVQDALQQVPGPDDEIIVLLQPTSPLRTAETVKQAIQMLEDDPKATSVVSVSPSYPIEWSLRVDHRGRLARAIPAEWSDIGAEGLIMMPQRRQDCEPVYQRDGVVYAFRRTVTRHDTIYGSHPLPLFTPPEEALSIDTPADWEEAVKRLAARASVSAGSGVAGLR